MNHFDIELETHNRVLDVKQIMRSEFPIIEFKDQSRRKHFMNCKNLAEFRKMRKGSVVWLKIKESIAEIEVIEKD